MNEQSRDPQHLTLHQSYREQAREVIRGMIVSGKMAPDGLYSVPKIASDLSVSATPVREALLDLVREGLLRPVRNRGFQVVIMTPKEHDDVYQIRLLLEVPSVHTIASGSQSAQQMKELYALAELTRKFAGEGDLIAYLNADRQFHVLLIRLIGLANTGAKSHIIKSAEEHFELLDAIAARDADRASDVIRRHLKRSRDVWGAPIEDQSQDA